MNPLPRLDKEAGLMDKLRPHCRLKPGQVWEDPLGMHRVGCLDATQIQDMFLLTSETSVCLAIQDPPYNLVAFNELQLQDFISWCSRWVEATQKCLAADSAMYVWLGADQKNGFQPLPDFMVMMRKFPFESRSFITLRNQRGYGTQKNWMAVRQELLYYTRGNPSFQVQYTDIPKILGGYYKKVGDQVTDNFDRGKSKTIRPGNVWVDVQQVFYRLQENVSGCYTQKPLKAIERIVKASSGPQDVILDSFAHSGTTLLACERLGRRCLTADIEPVFCEITIRRLERYRETGQLGWQNGHAFEKELGDNFEILEKNC
jgi:site-specific DNA-methyltransferase (adenine-specific)